MKYALIADIHAHLAALEAVLRDTGQQGCTRTACLGDIVGYFGKPKECVDIIRGLNIPCVQGDYDRYCGVEQMPEGFNAKAAENIHWTRAQLSEDDRQWLRNLPLVVGVDGFTVVHAHLSQPERWQYVFDKLAAATNFTHQQTPLCFFGHTHVPVAFIRDSVVRGGTYAKLSIEPGKQYFINVGSVGQPRDNNPKAAYVTYDTETRIVELRRVECPPPELPPGGGGNVPAGRPPVGPQGPLAGTAKEEND